MCVCLMQKELDLTIQKKQNVQTNAEIPNFIYPNVMVK